VGWNSALRRAAKHGLAPILPDRAYKVIQAASMARDIRSGAYFEPELEVALAALSPGDVALDLGANYGMYAVPMARRTGATGRVFAFEPVPFTADALSIVVRLLRAPNVDIRAQACGSIAGTATFSVPLQGSGAISAGQAHAGDRDDERPGHERHVRWEQSKQISCEVVKIDDALHDVRGVSLIKADIEGMELYAFDGARRIIERDLPTVITEINPWFLDGFGIHLIDLLEFFWTRGYKCYRYDEAAHRLREVHGAEEVVEDNYVFVHARRADRLTDFME